MIEFIIKIINLFQLDLKKYPSLELRRRKKLLDHHHISTILDVGANSGQYALETKKIGYKGKIISFEPVKSVYKKLKKNADKSSSWECYNYGLGDNDTSTEINISQNTYSSSILKITPQHIESAPESKVIKREKIYIKKLDSVFDSIVQKGEKVLLKIDVQGFEKIVLDGAKESLNKIKGIQIEMSIEELYKDEILYIDMIQLLDFYGFSLSSLENGFYNQKTGKLLQVDGIFFRD
jgi:FkbM family methyltransferase